MDQHEITEAGTLLDGRGRLREAGWSRRPLLSYERGAVAAPLRRIKEWDYYSVLAQDFGVSFMVADLGYVGVVSAGVFDSSQARYAHETYMVPLPLGSFSMPASSENGDVRVRHKKGTVNFSVMGGGARVVKVDFPHFDHGMGLRGAIVLNEQRGADSIVTATPWPKRSEAFHYNRKVNGLEAEGVVRYGDRDYVFLKDQAFGVLDWGRGVWPRSDAWCWATASWLVDGRPFGFNVGYGFGDVSRATENAIFRDGVLHKLGAVTFHIPPRDSLAPWRFTSDDGRLEMTLEPILDRSSTTRFLLYSSAQHQVCGRFSGRAVLDDGSVVEFSGIPGTAEKFKNRW